MEITEYIALARLYYIIVTTYTRHYFEQYVGRYFPFRKRDRHSNPKTWKITRAFLLRDEGYDYEDITSWFLPDEEWKDDIFDAHPDWNDWKLELRCTYAGRKCRIILRPHDELRWPPRDPDLAPHIHALRAPQGILSATLVAKKGIGAKDVDVTARVQKYAGFDLDYHGTAVRVRDLFPMDDHEDNESRFEGVRIIEMTPQKGLVINTFSYTKNETLF